jgi:hypothetical protein
MDISSLTWSEGYHLSLYEEIEDTIYLSKSDDDDASQVQGGGRFCPYLPRARLVSVISYRVKAILRRGDIACDISQLGFVIYRPFNPKIGCIEMRKGKVKIKTNFGVCIR